MEITVDLVGGHTETVRIEDGTYGDLLREVGFHPQEATVLVDGQPVPVEEDVEATEVQVLRLIAGGDHTVSTVDDLVIKPATEADVQSLIDLLDRAMLDIDRDRIRRLAGSQDVVVATSEESILGGMVLTGEEVNAIAVAPPWRNSGIGRALIEWGLADRGTLKARFDSSVRPFYAALEFEIKPDGERLLGVRHASRSEGPTPTDSRDP